MHYRLPALFDHLEFDDRSKKITFAWLSLAVMSLVFAGVFAFLLAASRTPGIQNLFDSGGFIYTALVVHVVLLLVIWFLAFCGVLLSLSFSAFRSAPMAALPLGWAGFILAAAGTSLLILPAFLKGGVPSLNNYIPVLQSPVYYSGLILFASGLFISLLHTALSSFSSAGRPSRENVLSQVSFGMAAFGVSIIVALCCFALAYKSLPDMAISKGYFERLFWGGGHILQASNTIGMLCAWLLLARLTMGPVPIPDRVVKFLFIFTVLFILPSPLLYFRTHIMSMEHKVGFTTLMQWGLSPATVLIGLGILKLIFSGKGEAKKLKWSEPGFSSLVFSMVLFAVGGIIGILIVGSDVRIPSHYHGVIGAVTLSFMGLSYYLLPLLGRKVYFPKLSRIQPYLYGIGQLLFILGLFLAGAHGVQRKTYGEAQNLDQIAKIAGMAIMGIGGLVAISGGVSYVLNMIFSMFGKSAKLKTKSL